MNNPVKVLTMIAGAVCYPEVVDGIRYSRVSVDESGVHFYVGTRLDDVLVEREMYFDPDDRMVWSAPREVSEARFWELYGMAIDTRIASERADVRIRFELAQLNRTEAIRRIRTSLPPQ